MSYLIKLKLLVFVFFWVQVFSIETSKPSPKPANVIIFLVDDLGYGDLGISGHPTSRTPNIDAMAQNGKFMTHFYVTSPICSPSRASLLTGRYHVRSGVYPNTFEPECSQGLPKNETTIANVLKNSGYNTEIVGKWHLGVGHNREFLPGEGSYGFDNYFGFPYPQDMCPCPVCFPNNVGCTTRRGGCWEFNVSCPLFSNKIIVDQPVYLPTLAQRFVDQALHFIRKSNADGSPFFLYMPFLHIHRPQFSSEQFVNMSPRGRIGDALLELDWMVGEVMSLLKELQIDNNTLTWFTSDNGPTLEIGEDDGCAGLLRCGKGTTWEGGVRVPAIVHWPGKIKSGRSNALISTLDMLPTIAKMVGIHQGYLDNLTLDGMDVSAVLLDEVQQSPREFFAVYPQFPSEETGPYAVFYNQYKAHFYTKGSELSESDKSDGMCLASHRVTRHDPPLLFDLHNDPGEKYDLANDAKHSEILEVITKWRLKHMSEMTWMKSLTLIRDVRAQPCCTKPTCEPFPKCCDCTATSNSTTEGFSYLRKNP